MTVTAQIFALAVILTLVWGWHLFDTVNDYRSLRVNPDRTKRQMGDSFRSLIAAACLWSICVGTGLRTGIILLGFGDALGGQVAFFAIMGINIPGGIFAIVSRKLD